MVGGAGKGLAWLVCVTTISHNQTMAHYRDSMEDEEFTIDCLPLDCIVYICEFLPVNDLGRFCRVCKLFYDASVIGSLWRRQCLLRWTFCDVQQISAGPQQWRRYFLARRSMETRMERGRPGQDYKKVKTLRGHEKDITKVLVVSGDRMNWENPHPPLVISLSQDACIKAWDVTQGKPVWTMEGQGTTAIAGNSQAMELATGGIDGRVELWDCEQWSKKLSFSAKRGGQVLSLKFGKYKSSDQLLLVYVSGTQDQNNQLEVWQLPPSPDPSSDPLVAVPPDNSPPLPELVRELWAPAHNCKEMQLSSNGLLALPGTAGDVHIWDLTKTPLPTAPSPLPPHITLDTHTPVGSLHWTSPGVITTFERIKISHWDVRTKLKPRAANHDTINIYSATRETSCDSHVTAMAMVNDLIVVGNMAGQVCVYDGSPNARSALLQQFTDHKGPVTDIYADRYRVLTCSKDFSIRVYCWKKDGDKVTLESKYTLLGGSVALKNHDGFNKVLCESSSCLGVAGNQIKYYTFTSPPLVEQKVLNVT